jgi:predicted nucleic acid-binding protein
MILLDTNVISEPLRRAPEARVINWIDAQSLLLNCVLEL